MHVPNRFTPARCAAPGAAFIAVAHCMFQCLVASNRCHAARRRFVREFIGQLKSGNFFNASSRFRRRCL
jgi:hypothetical protein